MSTETTTPWRRVVARFGLTPAVLAKELGRHRSKVTRAVNDPEGLISGKDQKALKEVAARLGVTLEPTDLVSQGYYGLPVRDEVVNDTVTGPGTPIMATAWMPTPDELAALNAGAPIHLTVVGRAHPPVMMGVGDVPAAE